jgi:succinate dehydrogenase / fumarate reductase flavoprotein subunit
VTDALQEEKNPAGLVPKKYQTEGEAVRNDSDFCYVSAWGGKGHNSLELHKAA